MDTSSRHDRIPPHSEEAERGLIGSCLMDYHKIAFVISESGANADWFYIPAFKTIFEVITDMGRKGRPVDVLTVSDQLKRVGHLERIGGEAALDRLIDSTPTSAHAEYYLTILKEKWQARHMIDASRETERLVMGGEAPVEVAGRAMSSISSIFSTVNRRTPEQLREQHKAMRERARKGGQAGLRSRHPEINSLLGSMVPGNHVVIAAQTSTGKTAYTLNDVLDMAINQGARVAWHENDMTLFDVKTRASQIISGINSHVFLTNHWTDNDAKEFDAAWEYLDSLPIYWNADRLTMDEFEAWCIALKCKHDINVVVADFLQKMKRTREEWRHPFREVIGDWSCRACELGKRLDAVSIILSQFSRSGKKEKGVTPDHPTLESLKEAGEIENNADIVILLSKKPGQNEDLFTFKHPVWDIDVDIAKHRMGPTGIKNMCLHITSQRFMSQVEGDEIRKEHEART